MPSNVPSLDEIYQRARGDIFEASSEERRLRFNLLDVHAKAIAGASHTLHGHIAHVETRQLPTSRDPEAILHWARITGTVQREATGAEGEVIFKGENGAVIPAGTRLQAPQDRVYYTREKATITSGEAKTTIISEGVGRRYNLQAETVLAIINPIAGVRPQVTVAAAGLRGGSDAESLPELQRRYLFKLRNPPRGGHITDYIRWVEEVPGVARAFVFRRHQGVLNHVGVTFTVNEENPVPTIESEIVRRVRSHLDAVRPEAAKVTVFVPRARPLALDLTISPDTEAVRSAATAEVKDLLIREAGVGGAYETDGTIYISHLREAIAQAEGEHHHVLHAPTEDVRPALYELVTFGGINWRAS